MSDSASRPFRSEQKLAKEAKGGPELGFLGRPRRSCESQRGSVTSARSFTKGSEADFEQKLAKEAKGGRELGFWDASHGPASPSGGSSTSARSFTKGSEGDFEQKLAKEAKGTKGRSSGVAGVQE
jgi:hypothetical protein